MEFQSKEYYENLSKKLNFVTKALINGEFVDSISGETFVTVNPATGKKITDITSCIEEDVELAVQAAKQAFADGRWSKLEPAKRKQILMRFADLILEHQAKVKLKILPI